MKKQFSVLLTFTLLLSGCTAQNTSSTPISASGSSAEPVVAMGRYIEKNIQFPGEKATKMSLSRSSMNTTQDGNFVIHARSGMCKTFISQSGQWVNEGYNDEDMLKPVSQKYLERDESRFQSEQNAKPYIYESLMMAANEVVGPDGYTFSKVTYRYFESPSYNQGYIEEKTKIEPFCASYNGSDARYYNIPELIKISKINEEDIYTDINRISRHNVLILSNKIEFIFYDLSVEGGKRLGALPNVKKIDSVNWAKYLAIVDDNVLVADENEAIIYSLSTGEELAKVALEGIQQVCEGVDGAFYALNQEGIWRILPNGGILQRVIDGSTQSFSAPAFLSNAFIQDYDGSFYVLGNNNLRLTLFKYEFSQSTPLEREKTLHLWALRDSPTVREASAEFMRQNPEVKVYVEIAPKDIEPATATENLVSALIAGTGPDLIITDGIDLAELDVQSVLAPISTEVDLMQYDKRLLPYGQLNSRQIAIGTKLFSTINNRYNDMNNKLTGLFNIEKLLVDAKANTQTIKQMKEKAGNNTMINPLLAYTSRQEAYDTIYTAASAEIWQNGFNKQAAQIALQLLNEIESKYINSDEDVYVYQKNYLVFSNAASYYTNELSTAGLYGKANLVLSRMIAYSANTQNEALCIAFINTMLSEYVQTAHIEDGNPVSKSISNTTFDKDYNQNTQMVFALDCLVRQNTGEILELSPDVIQIITEKYTRDDGFKQITYEYLDGKIDLDTALSRAEKLK